MGARTGGARKRPSHAYDARMREAEMRATFAVLSRDDKARLLAFGRALKRLEDQRHRR